MFICLLALCPFVMYLCSRAHRQRSGLKENARTKFAVVKMLLLLSFVLIFLPSIYFSLFCHFDNDRTSHFPFVLASVKVNIRERKRERETTQQVSNIFSKFMRCNFNEMLMHFFFAAAASCIYMIERFFLLLLRLTLRH